VEKPLGNGQVDVAVFPIPWQILCWNELHS